MQVPQGKIKSKQQPSFPSLQRIVTSLGIYSNNTLQKQYQKQSPINQYWNHHTITNSQRIQENQHLHNCGSNKKIQDKEIDERSDSKKSIDIKIKMNEEISKKERNSNGLIVDSLKTKQEGYKFDKNDKNMENAQENEEVLIFQQGSGKVQSQKIIGNNKNSTTKNMEQIYPQKSNKNAKQDQKSQIIQKSNLHILSQTDQNGNFHLNKSQLTPQQRQYQIYLNKYKSNIIFIQTQIKQIISLTNYSQVSLALKQVKTEINQTQAKIRKLRLDSAFVPNDTNMNKCQSKINNNNEKFKKDQRKIQELRFSIQNQKKISNVLNIRQLQLDEIQSKLVLEWSQKSKIRQESQGWISQQVSQQSSSKSTENIKYCLSHPNQPLSISKTPKISQSKLYIKKQNIKFTDNSQNSSNIFYGKNSDICYNKTNQELKQNGKNTNSRISQISQILNGSMYPVRKMMYEGESQEMQEKCSLGTKRLGSDKQNGNKFKDYYEILEERIQILRQSIQSTRQENKKKQELLKEQKICLKKSIEFFKLQSLFLQSQNRRLCYAQLRHYMKSRPQMNKIYSCSNSSKKIFSLSRKSSHQSESFHSQHYWKMIDKNVERGKIKTKNRLYGSQVGSYSARILKFRRSTDSNQKDNILKQSFVNEINNEYLYQTKQNNSQTKKLITQLPYTEYQIYAYITHPQNKQIQNISTSKLLKYQNTSKINNKSKITMHRRQSNRNRKQRSSQQSSRSRNCIYGQMNVENNGRILGLKKSIGVRDEKIGGSRYKEEYHLGE